VFPWLAPWISPSKPYFRFERPPDQPTKVDCLSGSAMMIRRECLDEIGLFDEAFFLYAEDVDLCKRMSDAGRDVWYVPTDPISHHSGASSEKRSRFATVHFYRSAAIYYRKHFMRGRRLPRALDLLVLAGLRVRLTLDLAALALGTRTQVGSVKPRERSM
jgi:GT2 family glycosyltransferase